MEMKGTAMLVWWLWCAIGTGSSQSENGFEDFEAKEKLLSFLETGSASSAASQPLVVPLTLIQGAASKGAVCLDGTLPGYHIDPGLGSGASSWLIQLEGGGWCNSIKNCISRKTTRRGSSKYMEKQLNFTGILSNKAEENPDFFNWNRVKVRYCDGASFTGDNQDQVNNLNFRGQRIWSAAMEELMAKGMQSAEQALLSGCSAGGLASILHCDEFRDLFPGTTKVKCLSDAGMFLDTVDVSAGHTMRNFFAGVVTTQNLGKNLPSSCTSQMDPTSCFFPQNLVASVKTPMFLLNAAYDAWQVRESLAPSSADPHGYWRECKADQAHCNASQIEFLQDFRNQMLNTIDAFSKSSQNGLFINSCFAHCQSEKEDTWFAPDSPSIGNKAVAVSVGDWFFDRNAVKAIDCPYPCDSTCHNLRFKYHSFGELVWLAQYNLYSSTGISFYGIRFDIVAAMFVMEPNARSQNSGKMHDLIDNNGDVSSTITISQCTRLAFTLLNLVPAALIVLEHIVSRSMPE